MKVGAITTAIVCLGQAFLSHKPLPLTFLSRLHSLNNLFGKLFISDPQNEANLNSRMLYRNDSTKTNNYVILSGGDVLKNGVTEATVMFNSLQNKFSSFIPATISSAKSGSSNGIQFILEEESRTTLENFIYTNEIIKQYEIQRVYLVTNDFHMFRSLLLADVVWNQGREKVEIIPIPAASMDSSGILSIPNHNTSFKSNHQASNFSFTMLDLGESTKNETANGLNPFHRPFSDRPKDLNEWYLMEKLDLERKALRTLSETFQNYSSLRNLALSWDQVEQSLHQLAQYNQSLSQTITSHYSSRNSSDNVDDIESYQTLQNPSSSLLLDMDRSWMTRVV